MIKPGYTIAVTDFILFDNLVQWMHQALAWYRLHWPLLLFHGDIQWAHAACNNNMVWVYIYVKN